MQVRLAHAGIGECGKGQESTQQPIEERGLGCEKFACKHGNAAGHLVNEQGLSAVRVHEEIRAVGYDGSYSILRDWIRSFRLRRARRPHLRFETAPGEQAQADLSSYTGIRMERERMSVFRRLGAKLPVQRFWGELVADGGNSGQNTVRIRKGQSARLRLLSAL